MSVPVPTSLLAVEGLHSGYGRIPILGGITLSVREGEFVGILGHNGMGKTTLLRTLMGYLPATAGRVRLDGADITRRSPTARARAGIGYVPQGREIFPALSVRENLRMGCLLSRRGEDETIADILKAMRDQTVPPAGQVKAPSEAEVTGQLDAKGKAMIEKLNAAGAGSAFDREYIRGQIEGHRALLQIQETYLASGKDRETLAVAKLARGQIKEHLVLLADIEEDLKG